MKTSMIIERFCKRHKGTRLNTNSYEVTAVDGVIEVVTIRHFMFSVLVKITNPSQGTLYVPSADKDLKAGQWLEKTESNLDLYLQTRAIERMMENHPDFTSRYWTRGESTGLSNKKWTYQNNGQVLDVTLFTAHQDTDLSVKFTNQANQTEFKIRVLNSPDQLTQVIEKYHYHLHNEAWARNEAPYIINFLQKNGLTRHGKLVSGRDADDHFERIIVNSIAIMLGSGFAAYIRPATKPPHTLEIMVQHLDSKGFKKEDLERCLATVEKLEQYLKDCARERDPAMALQPSTNTPEMKSDVDLA